jgi:M6 family metalloprotease-like protein
MSWDGPEFLSGQFTEGSLCAVSWATNRLDIFGVGSDRTLQHWWYENGWGNNGQAESLGGRLSGGRGLCAVSWGANRLDVFAIGGAVGAATLQHWWYENGWGNNGQPESLGGDFFGLSGLSAVSWAANRLDIFGIHGRDRTLQHWWYENGWGNNGQPESLGGHLDGDSALSAVSWGANRLDIFGIGHDDGTLQHWWYESGWGNNGQPESLGGLLFGARAVSAISWGANRLDIFGISGHDDTLQHWWYENGWGNNGQAESLGGLLWGGHSINLDPSLAYAVSAVSRAQNRLDVFAMGLDEALHHWWYENGWGNQRRPETFGGLLHPDGLSAIAWGANRIDIFAPRGEFQPQGLQHWIMLPGDVIIPDLDPKETVYKTEGPTDFTIYAQPEGNVRAVMLFVDFSDATGESVSASDTADHLLGNGQAQDLYANQSHQKLTLEVTSRSDLGWRRMPHPSTAYSFQTFETHRTYFTDAASLFSSSEVQDVTFSDYTFVLLVAPPTAGFPLSPAFNASPGNGASSSSGEIRLGVTFGTDSYTNRYINLVHEVGHLFGLPDLYRTGGGADTSEAGCWCIMSDIFHCVSFLGWHQHKNGWLNPSKKVYLSHNTMEWYTMLSPFSADGYLSMVVLPIDDALKPSKVMVIEVAQPVLGTNGLPWGEGILLYTVDARIPTGQSPVTVFPKKISTSPIYGHLHEALYTPNDPVPPPPYMEGTTSITLNILEQRGSSYIIKIRYQLQ